MDKCNKFKVFTCLLILCSSNIFLFRYFSKPGYHLVAKSVTTASKRTRSDFRSMVIMETTEIKRVPSNSRNNFTTENIYKGDTVSDRIIHPLIELEFQSTYKKPNTSSLPQHTVYSDQNKIEGSLSARSLTNETLKTTSHAEVLWVSTPDSKTLCPLVPPGLNGRLAIYMQEYSWEDIAEENPRLLPGGRYKPQDCVARHRVAIIIPYRNRDKHLKILLQNLHPMLARQQLDYGIYVVEQALPGKFNRAMLMNIGYVEAMKRYDYQCAIFHDVDLVPENDWNIYSCPEMPRHMSAAVDKFQYRLPYSDIYGGVSAVSKEQFENINGFSNMFFGWGGEDDDMSYRIKAAGLKITRYPLDIARYKMIKHVHDTGNEVNPMRHKLLEAATKRMAVDGLNSLVYQVLQVEELPTHLKIQVLIKEEDILKP
ncbi:unnamed protein product [Candidula unifasciata]|uniref:Beta-1,4-galactosyltransferase n=1 Tax=Candidula unifasciata TaxID=100452 RepID=A0A8S3Z8P7_9EUPU|nr:unnamed protein product [Candidula unifasciata]